MSTDAFSGLLGAHATLTRELSAALVASHGLTINDYGCLLLLHRAGEEGMRGFDRDGRPWQLRLARDADE